MNYFFEFFVLDAHRFAVNNQNRFYFWTVETFKQHTFANHSG